MSSIPRILTVQSAFYPDMVKVEIYDVDSNEENVVCKGAKITGLTDFDEEDQGALEFQAGCKAMATFVLNLALNGVDIESKAFGEAFDTVMEEIAEY